MAANDNKPKSNSNFPEFNPNSNPVDSNSDNDSKNDTNVQAQVVDSATEVIEQAIKSVNKAEQAVDNYGKTVASTNTASSAFVDAQKKATEQVSLTEKAQTLVNQALEKSKDLYSNAGKGVEFFVSKLSPLFDIGDLTLVTLASVNKVVTGFNKATNEILGTSNALRIMQKEGFNTEFINDISTFTKALLFNAEASRELGTTAVAYYDDFNKALTRTNTLLNTTKEALELNGIQVQKLVQDDLKNAVTSVQALSAQYEVLSGGFVSAAESQNVMTASLKLATAGDSEAGETTRLLVSTLRAYDQEASQASRTAAILNGVVELGITTVSELTQGFGQASSVAKSAGLSIEELGASVAVLTTRGIRTPVALTAIQSLAETIIDKSPQAAEALSKLRDAEGKVIRFDAAEIRSKGFVKSLQDLNTAIDGNAAKLAEIFPEAQSYRAALALMANGSKDLEKATVSLGEKTAAALDKVFGISLDNQSKKFTSIVNSFGESLINLGRQLAPAFEVGVNLLQQIVQTLGKLNDLPDPVKKVGVFLLTGSIAVANITSGLKTLALTVVSLIGQFILFKTATELFTGRIGIQIKAVKDLITTQAGVGAVVRQLMGIDQTYIAILRDKAVALERITQLYKLQQIQLAENQLTEENEKSEVKKDLATIKKEAKAKVEADLETPETKAKLAKQADDLFNLPATERTAEAKRISRDTRIAQDILVKEKNALGEDIIFNNNIPGKYIERNVKQGTAVAIKEFDTFKQAVATSSENAVNTVANTITKVTTNLTDYVGAVIDSAKAKVQDLVSTTKASVSQATSNIPASKSPTQDSSLIAKQREYLSVRDEEIAQSRIVNAQHIQENTARQANVVALNKQTAAALIYDEALAKEEIQTVGVTAATNRMTLSQYASSRSMLVLNGAMSAGTSIMGGVAKASSFLVELLTPLFAVTLLAAAAGFIAMNSSAVLAAGGVSEARKSLIDINEELRNNQEKLRTTSKEWRDFYKAVQPEKQEQKGILDNVSDYVRGFVPNTFEYYGKTLSKVIQPNLQDTLNKGGAIPISKLINPLNVFDNIANINSLGDLKRIQQDNEKNIAAQTNALYGYTSSIKENGVAKNVEVKGLIDKVNDLQAGKAQTETGKLKQDLGVALNTDDLVNERKKTEDLTQAIEAQITATEKRIKATQEAAAKATDTKYQQQLEKENEKLNQQLLYLEKLKDSVTKLADSREQYFTGQASLQNNLFGTKQDLVTQEQVQQSEEDARKKKIKLFEELGAQGNLKVDYLSKKDATGKEVFDEQNFRSLIDLAKRGNVSTVTGLRDVLGVNQENAANNISDKQFFDLKQSIATGDITKVRDSLTPLEGEKIPELKVSKFSDNKIREFINTVTASQQLEQADNGPQDKLNTAISEYELSDNLLKTNVKKFKTLTPEDVGGTQIQNLSLINAKSAANSFYSFKDKYEAYQKLTPDQIKNLTPEQRDEFKEVQVNPQVEGQKRLFDAITALDNAKKQGSLTTQAYSDALKNLTKEATLAGRPILKATDYVELLTKALEAETEAIKINLEFKKKQAEVEVGKREVKVIKETDIVNEDQKSLELVKAKQDSINDTFKARLEIMAQLTNETVQQAKIETASKEAALKFLGIQQADETKSLEIKQKLSDLEQERVVISSKLSKIEADNNVILARRAVIVAKEKGNAEDLQFAKESLKLAEQSSQKADEAINNNVRLNDLRKKYNEQEKELLKTKQGVDREAAEAALVLAKRKQITAEYAEQIRQVELLVSKNQEAFNLALRSIEIYSQFSSKEIENLNKIVSLRNEEQSLVNQAFGIAKELSLTEVSQRKLAREEAQFKLSTLRSQQQLEREIFEIQDEQRKISNERLIIENKIASLKAAAELKQAELEKSRLIKTNASKQDIEAQDIKITSARETLGFTLAQAPLIERQVAADDRLASRQRRNLSSRQELNQIEAEKALANTYYGRGLKNSVRQKAIDFARRQQAEIEDDIREDSSYTTRNNVTRDYDKTSFKQFVDNFKSNIVSNINPNSSTNSNTNLNSNLNTTDVLIKQLSDSLGKTLDVKVVNFKEITGNQSGNQSGNKTTTEIPTRQSKKEINPKNYFGDKDIYGNRYGQQLDFTPSVLESFKSLLELAGKQVPGQIASAEQIRGKLPRYFGQDYDNTLLEGGFFNPTTGNQINLPKSLKGKQDFVNRSSSLINATEERQGRLNDLTNLINKTTFFSSALFTPVSASSNSFSLTENKRDETRKAINSNNFNSNSTNTSNGKTSGKDSESGKAINLTVQGITIQNNFPQVKDGKDAASAVIAPTKQAINEGFKEVLLEIIRLSN